MSNPRIEEVSDSDDNSDPSISDPSEFLPHEVLRPANSQASPSNFQRQTNPPSSNPTLTRPPPPSSSSSSFRAPTDQEIAAKRAELKPYTTLYPVYFSANRTRHSGRRVSRSLAVTDPLAFNVLKAVRTVVGPSIRVAFEPDKTHPKDWANPGRVKVQLFDPETHSPLHPSIPNKQHLYNLVAEHLKRHPTRPNDPLELKLQGLPIPENFDTYKVGVPRGWKMNGILPVHSAAVSGGGVSDNFLKEAMEEMKQMQAAGGGGQLPGMGGGMGGMDMSAMTQMMQSMGGMGGFGGGGGGGGGAAGSGKKRDKKK